MRNKDTMLLDFRDFIYILKIDLSKSKGKLARITKMVRNFFLFITAFLIIPLSHLTMLILPFLKGFPQFSIEERLKYLK